MRSNLSLLALHSSLFTFHFHVTFQRRFYGVWRSPVARLLWEQEVPGSNPGAPICRSSSICFPAVADASSSNTSLAAECRWTSTRFIECGRPGSIRKSSVSRRLWLDEPSGKQRAPPGMRRGRAIRNDRHRCFASGDRHGGTCPDGSYGSCAFTRRAGRTRPL